MRYCGILALPSAVYAVFVPLLRPPQLSKPFLPVHHSGNSFLFKIDYKGMDYVIDASDRVGR